MNGSKAQRRRGSTVLLLAVAPLRRCAVAPYCGCKCNKNSKKITTKNIVLQKSIFLLLKIDDLHYLQVFL